ncbi:survival motor neuron protein-like isoform X2 [Montipora foliosa]|uniref:survival motor neuron protein-like isoform X2 n=1 Tax=Montipora foliosa TaxID=591990 RepID=UPI0035F1BFF4
MTMTPLELCRNRAADNDASADIWDDTALIEAYDKAISAIKSGGKTNSPKSKGGGKNRKQQYSKKKDSKNNAIDQWHIGDGCRAVYSEDDLIYDAVIISIDSKSNTCTVKFCGYGNTEEQNLNDLLPPMSKKSSKVTGSYSDWQESSGFTNGENEMEWTGGGESPVRWQISDLCLAPEYPTQHLHEAVINSFPTPYTCKVTFLRSRQRQSVDISALKSSCPTRHPRHHHPYMSDQRNPLSGSSFPSYPFSSNCQSSMNFFPTAPPPPIPPSLLSHQWTMPSPSGFQSSSNSFPFAPMPPPPAPVNNSDVSHDNDTLASMLMAWYLSGYHTGYYQATQNLRHESSARSSDAQVSTTDSDINKKQPSQPSET